MLSKNKILLSLALILVVLSLTACGGEPAAGSPTVVQMDGFNLYLSQPRNQIERILEPGAGGEYGDGSFFVDYPAKTVIVDYTPKGGAIQIRVNAEGTFYNGATVGMTREQILAIAPEWTYETENERLRTEYDKNGNKPSSSKYEYFIEYRFGNEDGTVDRIYLSYPY